jgi:hypothetical protein
MGILDRLSPTSQFIEVIEWLDDSPNTPFCTGFRSRIRKSKTERS